MTNPIPNPDDILPQHDLDERKRLGRETAPPGRAIERVPETQAEWVERLGRRENYTRLATPDLIIAETINRIVARLNGR